MKKRLLGKNEESLLRSREMIAWGQIGMAIAFICLAFSSCSNSSAIHNFSREQLATIQLCDGSALYAKHRFSNEREDLVIQDFTQQFVSLLWTWDGKNPSKKPMSKKEDQKNLDPGIKAENGQKVPISGWAASLMMNPKLANNFLNELSSPQSLHIPKGYFSGNFNTTVKVRYVSIPRQLIPGIWEVDVVSDRLIFNKRKNRQLKPIPFNRTLRIKAITISHSPLKEDANPLDRALYAINAKGLEVETILDFKP